MSDIRNKDYDPIKLATGGDFDFDYWADLYKKCPEEFEKTRAMVMDELIKNTPEPYRRRCKGLLFRIDALRRNPETPIKNCIEISKMMWDSLQQLQDVTSSPFSDTILKKERNAQILEFKRP